MEDRNHALEGETVLADIGCGFGRIPLEYAHALPQLRTAASLGLQAGMFNYSRRIISRASGS